MRHPLRNLTCRGTPRVGNAFLVLASFGLLMGGTACRSSVHATPLSVAQAAPPTTTSTTAPALPGVPPPTPLSMVAVATVDKVAVHETPDNPAVMTQLANPTIEGQNLALFVQDRRDDWLQVRMPVRPNGTIGWIRASDVSVLPVPNRIVISISERRLRVLDPSQRTIFDTLVAVGKPATPTPTGRFYVDVWMPNPGRPYGVFLLSVSGFSEVLKTFAGGRGQVAMHGWSDPSVVGKNVSNGCVRMRNEDIAKLADLAPLGTPIEIIA